MGFSLKNALTKLKYRNEPKAEQCIHCGRIEVNKGMMPFLFCTNDHPPRAMFPVNKPK